MEAGRELDALIAERVMGIERIPFDPSKQFIVGMPEDEQQKVNWTMSAPRYSADIADAWTLLDKIPHFAITRLPVTGGGFVWVINFQMSETKLGPIQSVKGTTAQHAICLAALKVK